MAVEKAAEGRQLRPRTAKTAAKTAITSKSPAKANTGKKRSTATKSKSAGVKKTAAPKKKATPKKAGGKVGRPAGSGKKTATTKQAPAKKTSSTSDAPTKKKSSTLESVVEKGQEALEAAGATVSRAMTVSRKVIVIDCIWAGNADMWL